jgi:hypothetical protein
MMPKTALLLRHIDKGTHDKFMRMFSKKTYLGRELSSLCNDYMEERIKEETRKLFDIQSRGMKDNN